MMCNNGSLSHAIMADLVLMSLQIHGQLSERECALVMFQCLQVMSLNVQMHTSHG